MKIPKKMQKNILENGLIKVKREKFKKKTRLNGR